MQYKVRITPIIPTLEVWEGPFQTEDEAWEWIERNNCPYVDYEVFPEESDTDSGQVDLNKPPWD